MNAYLMTYYKRHNYIAHKIVVTDKIISENTHRLRVKNICSIKDITDEEAEEMVRKGVPTVKI